MECQKCGKDNAYGAVYCLYCGEKISKERKEEAYRKTFFGKVQTGLDKINGLWIKKVIDNIIVKVLIMLLGIVFMVAGIKGDVGKLRLLESDIYQICYDEKAEEYYIITEEESFSLALYIPKFVDSIRVTGYKGDKATESQMPPEECEVIVNKGEFSAITIETIKNQKIKQSIKLSCR